MRSTRTQLSQRSARWARAAKDWAVKHPVVFVFLVALVVRLITALVINQRDALTRFAPDASSYFRLAADKARGAPAAGPVEEIWYDAYATYFVPLAFFFRLFGSHVYLAQAVTAVCGAGVAALVAALAARLVPRSWVLPAGLAAAFFPSQVLWSSLILRDPAVWLLTAAIGLVCFALARSEGRKALVMIGLAAVLMLLLGNLRMHTLVVAAWSLGVAGLTMAGRGWLLRASGLALVAVLVPWSVGAGPAGIDFVRGRDLTTIRLNLAQGARTAIVDPTPDQAADDTEETDNETETGDAGGPSNLSHLPEGLVVMVLEPVPWTSFDGPSVRLAQLELLLWYPLLLFAGVGVTSAIRRRMTGLAFPISFAGGILAMYALAEGNFGTAFRHRGEAVWAVTVLAVVGAHHLWASVHRGQANAVEPEHGDGGVRENGARSPVGVRP